MRDIKRIPKILKRLEKVWQAHPDLRLTQLFTNVWKSSGNIYFFEDESFISGLEKYYENIKFVQPKK